MYKTYITYQKKKIKGGLILAAPLVGLLLATTPVLALVPVADPVDEAADVTPDADTVVVEAVPSEVTEVVELTLVELVVVVWFPPSPHLTTVSQPPAKVSSQYEV